MGVIQRSPTGLLDVLSAKGMENLPQELLRDLRPTLDTLQFYGSNQRQILANAPGATAKGGAASVTIQNWGLVFGITGTVTKTATVTAVGVSIGARYNGDLNQEFAVASGSLGPFGATETGPQTLVWRAPYPLLVPPRTLFFMRLDILGTDATAVIVLGVDIGILG